MNKLNLPEANLRIQKTDGKTKVFDIFRNKFIILTPEEWVRQHFLHFLINNLNYPQNLIAVEKSIMVNGQYRRYDAVVYSRELVPAVVIEFKAPDITIDESVFDQIASYNASLNVNLLIISNGVQHYCVRYDTASERKWTFLEKIPDFSLIEK